MKKAKAIARGGMFRSGHACVAKFGHTPTRDREKGVRAHLAMADKEFRGIFSSLMELEIESHRRKGSHPPARKPVIAGLPHTVNFR